MRRGGAYSLAKFQAGGANSGGADKKSCIKLLDEYLPRIGMRNLVF